MSRSTPSIKKKNFRSTMKTKNIFKTLAFVMMMPTMLLTTACSSSDTFDDIINPTNEKANEKGYALPATVNVTRESDATRATFDNENKKLNFSEGDKLFVKGSHATAGTFAGTLDYVSDGTFSGTIYTQNEFSGTANELFTAASSCLATLLPDGYQTYGFLSVTSQGHYNAYMERNGDKAFALTKAAAVEQFSFEQASAYSSGFALSPTSAILNFTITDLAPNTDFNVSAVCSSLTPYLYNNIPGKVTSDALGAATFAVGIYSFQNISSGSLSLTIDGWNMPLNLSGANSRTLTSGHIYNITRSGAKPAATVTTAPTATAGDIVTFSSTALFNAGEATGGTMMYKVTDSNSKPASTDGFSTTIPTAQTYNPGTYYVWYYVQADNGHADSEIAGSVEVTVIPVTLAITNPVKGQIIGSDGRNYNVGSLPAGVTPVAMICYVSSSNGLALALADEGWMNWSTAGTTCAAHTPAFSNGTWKLPSQDEWKQMFKANGGDEGRYTGLNTTITTAGGTTLQENAYYWSSSELNPGVLAYSVYINADFVLAEWVYSTENGGHHVRACLAF